MNAKVPLITRCKLSLGSAIESPEFATGKSRKSLTEFRALSLVDWQDAFAAT
jgi:hypothetical protein